MFNRGAGVTLIQYTEKHRVKPMTWWTGRFINSHVSQSVSVDSFIKVTVIPKMLFSGNWKWSEFFQERPHVANFIGKVLGGLGWSLCSAIMFLYFNYPKCPKYEKLFFSVCVGHRWFSSSVNAKQSRWTVLAKNAKQSLCLNTLLNARLSQMHSLGPNKTFFFSYIWHCRPSAAWLSLAWCICLCGKKTPAYLSPSWIAQKCCQVELDRCGDWICSRQLHHSPNSSLYINLCLSWLLQLSSESH